MGPQRQATISSHWDPNPHRLGGQKDRFVAIAVQASHLQFNTQRGDALSAAVAYKAEEHHREFVCSNYKGENL